MTLPAAALLPGAHLLDDGSTIVARATASGRGALAIVRLSGPRVSVIADALLHPSPAEPRRAVHTTVRGADGTVLDEVVAVRYAAPRSFTGEDLLEITTHGGAVAAHAVMAAAITAGAREALPGEFTRRAVLHGKIDLLQAEAIGDLVDARSSAAHRMALRQLDGGLSRRIDALRTRVLELEALLAYDIDFPEEDDGPIAPERTVAALDDVERRIGELLATARGGELVREGALVVLAGKPNVGKSSLFNAVLGRSRAIVTPVPGTTRDALEAVVDTEPWPIRLVDTAGLRQVADLVERLGIEVSESYVRRAAVVLCCGEDAGALREVVVAVRRILERAEARGSCPLILVRTKCDLDSAAPDMSALGAELAASASVAVSAETGAGIQSLLKSIGEVLGREAGAPELDAPVLTQTRHRVGVERALAELRGFRRAWWEEALPATVAAVHLHAAAEALRDLIGGIDTEQILDEVFRRFCVGK